MDITKEKAKGILQEKKMFLSSWRKQRHILL